MIQVKLSFLIQLIHNDLQYPSLQFMVISDTHRRWNDDYEGWQQAVAPAPLGSPQIPHETKLISEPNVFFGSAVDRMVKREAITLPVQCANCSFTD